MNASKSMLTVERTDTTPSRPWVFVTGILEGEPMHIGDIVHIINAGQATEPAVIRSIEIHAARGKTTIALDGHLHAVLTPGSVVSA